ncbi:MAG: hypothetical protein DRP96_03125 [Candidatus Neomarinimicrobiota bacterium]|nr:MAG: hypothetical protein DRP96_03125 [Candidatus Neomarinimicrobiota bacterium]
MKKIFLLMLILTVGGITQTLPGPTDIFQQPPFYGNTPRLICCSPGDSVIAFVWNKSGYPNGDIWLADIPSGRLRQLTHYNDDPTDFRIEELHWFPDQERLVFLWKGDIYSIRPARQENPTALTMTPSQEILLRVSPRGRYISFIRDNTLRLLDIRKSREIELSKLMAADWTNINHYCQAGKYSPYYWSPDESALIIPSWNGMFAGELLYFDLINHETRIISLSEKDSLMIRDIAWIQSGKKLAIDCLSADLKTHHILLADPDLQRIDTLYTQASPLWVSNFGGKIHWLKSSEKLLFGDIQNGYRHIFTVGLDHKTPISITRGKWDVFDYTVNPAKDQVYFSANKDNHYEKHIYTIDPKSEKVLNVSYIHGSHDFVLSATGNYVVDIYSTTDTPPQLYLIRTFPVSKARLFLKSDTRIPNAGHLKATLEKTIVNPVNGRNFTYRLWYPARQLSADKFPLILFLNNPEGPVADLHEWQMSNLISQWFSNKEYVIAEIGFPDLEQVPYISGSTDSIPPWQVQLQIVNIVLDELAQQEFIDMTRIGITGFGYNGYLSIGAMLSQPETFSACVSIALNNRWETGCDLYQQILYQEMARRKLGIDLNSADIATRLRGKLLLIYSDNDLLAPLMNSEELIHKMVNAQKRIDFIHYPWEHTVIQSDQTYIDLFNKMLEYFDRFL